MDKHEFTAIRKYLGKTQKEIATLLGIAEKTVCSYEQGWRNTPDHVERQLIFLLSRIRKSSIIKKNCWELKKCPEEKRNKCPAWEYDSGRYCWLINGTICECATQKNWHEKIQICKNCAVMKQILDECLKPNT